MNGLDAPLADEPFDSLLGAYHEALATGLPPTGEDAPTGLAPALADRIRPDAEKLAHAQGFAGRLIVMGEPDFAGADCRIEWADGGVARDRASIETEIDTRLSRYIASLSSGDTA